MLFTIPKYMRLGKNWMAKLPKFKGQVSCLICHHPKIMRPY